MARPLLVEAGWLQLLQRLRPPKKDTAAKALAALAKRSAKPAAKGTAARPARRVPSTTEVVDRHLHLIEQELELPHADCEEDCDDPSCAQMLGRAGICACIVVRVVQTCVRWTCFRRARVVDFAALR